MALPTLTPEARQEALAKAKAAREVRRDLKAEISSGAMTVPDLLAGKYGKYADFEETLKKTRVTQVLNAMKGYGPAKVTALLDDCGVADNRRLGGLGHDQRRRLIEALEDEAA